MAIITSVVQMGGAKLDLAPYLDPDLFTYDYITFADADHPTYEEAQLDPLTQEYNTLEAFPDGQIYPRLTFAVCFVPKDSELWMDANMLDQLPAHTLIYQSPLAGDLNDDQLKIFELKGAHLVAPDITPAELGKLINDNFLGGQYGDHLALNSVKINPRFKGDFHQDGHHSLEFDGNYGTELTQLVEWKETFATHDQRTQKFYPEIATSDGVEVEFQVTLVPLSGPSETHTFRRDDPDDLLTFASPKEDSFIYLTMLAKGTGHISLGSVHFRMDRGPYGEFFVGGETHADPTHRGEEFVTYFNPGDMKPPLNVYFAGYRQEGFEGFFMMNSFKSPYLLFDDPRLEGGEFYLGSEEYEKAIITVIQDTLDKLGFAPDDLIMSGTSLGAFTALYYGARLNPRAIIVSKPLTNIGSIARNERVKRPVREFATSLDMMISLGRTNTVAGVDNLNDRFWSVFNQGHFENTIFAVGYMMQDDYDGEAFSQLQANLRGRYPGVRLLHKGFIGRQTDQAGDVNQYFRACYRLILKQEFGR
ncbi:accessory Sec system protein Asp2 [Levilactobacillus bambusae]|uniref:Accessory Sec system protein Asp2 n=1 Tax=Levilactobacillus bambusae TaxID=2024736 RepID=A0A2V1N039_9LACO|nr:accessory Sec system protein Asp2 [Levilactobacillus bambusae]PWF99709.1 accessory Sec system protein Asp2 [Levilactobacillus bambusae]